MFISRWGWLRPARHFHHDLVEKLDAILEVTDQDALVVAMRPRVGRLFDEYGHAVDCDAPSAQKGPIRCSAALVRDDHVLGVNAEDHLLNRTIERARQWTWLGCRQLLTGSRDDLNGRIVNDLPEPGQDLLASFVRKAPDIDLGLGSVRNDVHFQAGADHRG